MILGRHARVCMPKYTNSKCLRKEQYQLGKTKTNLLRVTENALLTTPASRRENKGSPGSEKDGNKAKNEINSTKLSSLHFA